MDLLFILTVLLLLHPSSAASNAVNSTSSLDPIQLTALRSLGQSTKTPCSPPHSLHNSNATVCDSSTPFRHLISLTLANCSDDVSLSTTALKSLSTLQDLRFLHCPVHLVHFPSSLTLNLHSFTSISSLHNLTGVWLSRFRNLTQLTVSGVSIKASGPIIILTNLKKLQSVTISNTSLAGHLPKTWHHNITHLDLSINKLRGSIHPSITSLENLISLNLSSNQLSGQIPASIGDLINLKNLSLSSNTLSGSIPDSMAALPSLTRLDLSSNLFNGTIPKFLVHMKELKYLNLKSNNFQGVLPFNVSFITSLKEFNVEQNPNLCYNHSTISSKVKLGLAPCDKYGLPMSPPAKSGDSGGDTDTDETDYDGNSSSVKRNENGGHHGPNKVVLGVAIAVASLIFLIIFLILVSRRCA